MAMARPKFVLIGDSLTQLCFEGWGSHLANIYQRRADIINRGYSGYNTKFYLNLDWIETEKLDNVKLVTIFFGANDAAIAGLDDHHHVSIEDYTSNLRKIVDRIKEQFPDTAILFITPPPVHHEQRLAFQIQKYGDKATGVLERTLENTGRYAEACQEVASALSLPCLNLYDDIQKEGNWSIFFNDGLHFSAEGHSYVGKALVDAINANFPDLKVTEDPRTGQFCNSASTCPALSSQGPYHDEIDHKDALKAFH